jgi:hypothetical protein
MKSKKEIKTMTKTAIDQEINDYKDLKLKGDVYMTHDRKICPIISLKRSGNSLTAEIIYDRCAFIKVPYNVDKDFLIIK